MNRCGAVMDAAVPGPSKVLVLRRSLGIADVVHFEFLLPVSMYVVECHDTLPKLHDFM